MTDTKEISTTEGGNALAKALREPVGHDPVANFVRKEICIAQAWSAQLYPHNMEQIERKEMLEAILMRLTRPSNGDRDAVLEFIQFVAQMPCETVGAEDLEPGCCISCRARKTLKTKDTPNA